MGLWQQIWMKKPGAAREEDPDFDPDALLTQAQQQMLEVQARNRERAVQAITQKNNLEQMVDDLRKKIEVLQFKATGAEEAGKSEDAAKIRAEIASYGRALESSERSLQQAIATAEQVKAAIRSEEERVQRKTAEALALRAQWKTAQVQRSLLVALVEVNTGLAEQVPAADRLLRHARNRRLVHQAIVQRNNLRFLLEDTQKRVELLREKAKLARARGDSDLENALLREMEQYEATLAGTHHAGQQAEEGMGRAVQLLQEEEETLQSMGLDPRTVTDEQITLYEARMALADVETDNQAKRRRERRMVWVAAAAIAVILVVIGMFV